MFLKRCLTVLFLGLAGTLPAQAPEKLELPADYLKPLTWRSIGPANMGGRIVALSVYEADPSTWWVATASGGLLKTTNNGVTFEHQFDREATVSIGDVAVAQSNKDIVWVGTGEHNPRNSVSYGDGVYKSVDGGKTWNNVGLRKSFQVGRIAIHPRDPDTVYVGALGRLYGPNEERGLYKTSDGGKTWEKILYVDERTGVIEVQMSPGDPDTLMVATYERKRDGHDSNDPEQKWGAGSAIYKTTDGGKKWTKLTKGLPTCKLGRVGLSYYRKDPRVVYAIVESEKIGQGPATVAVGGPVIGVSGRDATIPGGGAELIGVTQNGPADKAGLQAGDLITAIDDRPVRRYTDLADIVRAHKPGDVLKVTRRRGKEAKVVEVTLAARGGPGAGEGGPFATRLGGQRENAQKEQGANGHEYGGVYRSDDGGDTWKRVNSLNQRPMYFSQVRVDPSDDRRVYVLGIALYRSDDGGNTFRNDGGRGAHADHHALWIDPRDGRHMILGNDGGVYVCYDRMSHWDHLNTVAIGQFYHVALDSRRLYRAVGGLQDNGVWSGPTRTRGPGGPINEDWVNIIAGDGFTCRVDPKDPDLVYFTTQWGAMGRRNLRTREVVRFKPQAPRGQPEYRWNWNTPFIVSVHDSRVIYAAANVVFRSDDRGRDMKPISTDITATAKGSATALAESPRNPAILYVGSDDGKLWGSRDMGKSWTDLTSNVGLPGPRCVSSIEPSRTVEGRVYVVFDAHRSDDDRPCVYVSEDFGKTWKSLHGGLPAWGTTRVLREDSDNPNLLYLGTEFFLFCSLDRGAHWLKLNNNLPTVAIHEVAQHPTAGEIVVATHGRSLWVLDVTALRQITPATRTAPATLLKPAAVVRWQPDASRGQTNRRFVGDNPPPGASVYYTLTRAAEKVELKVVDDAGKTLRELKTATSPGLHKSTWDLDGPARMGGARMPVSPGTYRVVLTVDGVETSQPLKIENDPTTTGSP